MTSPADKAPPDPQRGNAVRKMIAGPLLVAAGVCILVASALLNVHNGQVPAVCVYAAAAVFSLAALVVLAGKGRQP
jgi:uncharacterized membrane protein